MFIKSQIGWCEKRLSCMRQRTITMRSHARITCLNGILLFVARRTPPSRKVQNILLLLKFYFYSGIYHGRISLPADYPMKPPNIFFMTPNGRFETNTKICLSISGFHPETWRPSWSIRTALLAMIGFMPTHGNGAIGSLGKTLYLYQF